MKRAYLLLPSLLLCFSVHAQTHSASLSWQKPVTGAAYNVYRANCTGTITNQACSQESAFTKVATSAKDASTFTNTGLVAGQSYAWYITTLCDATTSCPTGTVGESGPSNHIAATAPNNVPPPPTNLTITSVAVTTVGNQDRLQVDWTDTSGSTSAFTIFGGQGQILKQGSQTSGIGVYSIALRFPPQSGLFVVCNQRGDCVVQAFKG